jgi:hypothetical protein
MPLRNAHQPASTTSSSSYVDLMGGGVGTIGGQGQQKKVAQKGRKRTANQQGYNSVVAKVGGSGKKKTQRTRDELWGKPKNWNADRPSDGGGQTQEAWVGPMKYLKLLGKKMWVDPLRIQGGNYVFAKVKRAGDEDEWPEAKWHTPNTAISDTPLKNALKDIKVVSGDGNLRLSEWLKIVSPVV